MLAIKLLGSNIRIQVGIEGLLSKKMLEWLWYDRPDISEGIEHLLADVYEQSQSTGSTPHPDSIQLYSTSIYQLLPPNNVNELLPPVC